jgi:hypothetical protein
VSISRPSDGQLSPKARLDLNATLDRVFVWPPQSFRALLELGDHFASFLLKTHSALSLSFDDSRRVDRAHHGASTLSSAETSASPICGGSPIARMPTAPGPARTNFCSSIMPVAKLSPAILGPRSIGPIAARSLGKAKALVSEPSLKRCTDQ